MMRAPLILEPIHLLLLMQREYQLTRYALTMGRNRWETPSSVAPSSWRRFQGACAKMRATLSLVSIHLFLLIQKQNQLTRYALIMDRNRWETPSSVAPSSWRGFQGACAKMRAPLSLASIHLFLLIQKQNQLTRSAICTGRNRKKDSKLSGPSSSQRFPTRCKHSCSTKYSFLSQIFSHVIGKKWHCIQYNCIQLINV